MIDDLVIIDTETTGVGDADVPVEVAALRLADGETFHSLLNPLRPIPLEARAVHHIKDEDVAAAPTLAEVEPALRKFVGDKTLVAHGAAFDRRMLPFFTSRDWLCSLRLAHHVLREAECYRNEYLLELLAPQYRALDTTAHRAMADVRMTAAFLPALIRLGVEKWSASSAKELAWRAGRPYVVTRMPFGKYKNEELNVVPKHYIRYALREWSDIDDDLRMSLKLQLKAA